MPRYNFDPVSAYERGLNIRSVKEDRAYLQQERQAKATKEEREYQKALKEQAQNDRLAEVLKQGFFNETSTPNPPTPGLGTVTSPMPRFGGAGVWGGLDLQRQVPSKASSGPRRDLLGQRASPPLR